MNTEKKHTPAIVFATNNGHKLTEARAIVGDAMQVLSLADIGCGDDIPETAGTLEGNALIKARYIRDNYGYDCFADDTGLEVDALGGAPGVHSARYAEINGKGQTHDSQANMLMLLDEMKGKTVRSARFRTAVALCRDGKEHLFEGRVEGEITAAPLGNDGFGYDPVFRPQGFEETFAQMDPEQKNSISHRGRAMKALMQYLMKNNMP